MLLFIYSSIYFSYNLFLINLFFINAKKRVICISNKNFNSTEWNWLSTNHTSPELHFNLHPKYCKGGCTHPCKIAEINMSFLRCSWNSTSLQKKWFLYATTLCSSAFCILCYNYCTRKNSNTQKVYWIF